MKSLLLASVVLTAIAAVIVRDQADRAAAVAPLDHFVTALSCSFGSPSAYFRVPSMAASSTQLAAEGARGDVDQVWIDLSLFDNDFRVGTFIGTGPFRSPDETTSFAWMGLIGGRHYYRLNALVGSTWHEVGRGTFEMPDCNVISLISCMEDGSAEIWYSYETRAVPAGAAAPVNERWFDISLLNNGFAPGSFLGMPFASENTIYDWQGLLPSRRHFYRFNYKTNDGRWTVHQFGSFETLDCSGLPDPAPLPSI